MFPIINLLSRVPPWTSINNPSQRLELLYTCFTLQENKSLKYIIKPPQSLHDFPAWIRRYPGRLKILVSCLSESHLSCKQIALKRIPFSSRRERNAVKASNLLLRLWMSPIFDSWFKIKNRKLAHFFASLQLICRLGTCRFYIPSNL